VTNIELSGITAMISVILGAIIGYAIYRWPWERFRDASITLSAVTTNLAGAALAFAFGVILGLHGSLHNS